MKSVIENLKELLLSKDAEYKRLKYFVYTSLVLWSLIIASSLIVSIVQNKTSINNIAENIARANFEKDQAFRSWAASHGGVYVPTNERTPPNPHLSHIPYRDITKPDGTKLTLMNPAYMVRQMSNEYSGLYGAKSKITSLKYLNKINKPDKWEIDALKSFERGNKEKFEFTKIGDEPYLRLMRPMYTKQNCLKCHGFQGYKVGDIRGGVGVSLPLKDLYAVSDKNRLIVIFLYLVIWLLGIIGIFIFSIREFLYLKKTKKTKDALRENEAKFRVLYNKSPDMYVSVSPKDASILFCNDTLLERTGYTREEIIGKPIFMMYHEECMDDVKRTFEEFVKKGTIHDRELILKTKDGTKIDVNLNVNTVRDKEGKALYSMSSWRDITEHKKMESEIRIAKEYLQAVFEVTPNIIITTDGNNIQKSNPAMLEFTGFNSLDAFKKEHDCICDLFLEEKGLLHAKMGEQNWLEYALSHPEKLQKVRMLKDEKTYSFIVLAKPLHSEVDNTSLVVFNDVTQMEEALNELKEKDEIMIAQSRHAAMGEMISMIAHQWRQPISAIAMDANNILADIGLETVNDESLSTVSRDIIYQTQELSKTIDDFKNFFRPGRTTEETTIKDIFNEAFSVVGKSLQNNNVEIKKDFQTSSKITTYSRELMQVIINIIKNAKEALVDNREENREITISIKESSNHFIIDICDNAGGIDTEIIDKIFDPYFTTKGEKQGTGLGLYMSKTIVEKHLKGKITAANINDGACFKITLPRTL